MKFTSTPRFLRLPADWGTKLYLQVLLLPFFPFTWLAENEVFRCKHVHFTSAASFEFKRKAGLITVGSVWDAYWMENDRTGEDGKHLCVMTPKGVWFLDERAGNCTRPRDPEHRCWVRHGSARDGTLCVDKRGDTCHSGAGSIRLRGYHARLMNNHLVHIPFF